MTAKQRMLAGELYQAWDDELVAERSRSHALCREFNGTMESPPEQRLKILRELLGRCPEPVTIEPGLRCDYGYNISIGDNFYANFDLIILDVTSVTIGKNCMFGPRVSIFTAAHPFDVETRVAGWEFGKPVSIGDNVWIGGGTIINPGVTIGDNVVVGSGAVVTKSVPADVVVAGNPARVIREL